MNSDFSHKNILQKVVKGSIWTFALRIFDRFLIFISTIILARLLAPKDFGLFGIALVAIMTLKTFSKTGFQSALIQKKEDITDYFNTAWTAGALRGLTLAFILFSTAPYISVFFNEPGATPILQVLALSLLVQGIINPRIAYFQRELNFRKWFIYEISGTLFDVGAAVTLALLFRNVWALVFGLLARHLIQLILSFLMTSQRVEPKLELNKFKELFSFGKYIFLSSIFNFLLIQGSQTFVGKILGTVTLGFYVLAFRITDLPTREVIGIVSRTTFPAYSRLQDQLPKIQKGYLKIFQTVSFILVPLSVGLAVLAKDFTQLFLGEKWISIVSALQVLAIAGGLRAIHTTSHPLFQGIGKPGIETKLRFTQILFLGMIIYPFSQQWNLLGTCLALLLSELLIVPFYIYQIIKIIKLSFWKLLKMAIFPILAALVMLGAVLLLKAGLGRVTTLEFFILVFTGISTYFCLIYIFDYFFKYGIIRTVNKYFIKRMRT